MKRLLASVLVVVLALSLAACAGAGGSGGGGTGVGSKKKVTTVDELKAAFKADQSKATWYADLKDITTETHLGAEVLVLHVGWGTTEADYAARQGKTDAMREALWAYDCPLATNAVLVDASGEYSLLGSSGEYGASPMAIRFKLPAAPQTPAEVKAWLAEVYGPGGLIKLGPEEKWYSSITSIGPGKDGAKIAVVTTLSSSDKGELAALQTALITTGSPLLAMVGITGNGNYISLSAGGEPGTNGYYYPDK